MPRKVIEKLVNEKLINEKMINEKMPNGKLPNGKLPDEKNTEIKSYDEYIKKKHIFSLYFASASMFNQGPSSYGGVIYISESISPQQREFACYYEYMGQVPNKEAVYRSLLEGLKKVISLNIRNLNVYGEFDIQSIQCFWKVKNPNLKHICDEIKSLLCQFDNIDFNNVCEKNNKRANELANMALNNHLDKINIAN